MVARNSSAVAGLAALFVLAGCYDVTRRRPEGDADLETPEPARCDEDSACEGGGLDLGYSFSGEGEVVEVAGDRAVLLGTDGQPITYRACGLALAGAVRVGDLLGVSHTVSVGWSSCRVTTLAGADGPVAAVSRCEAEGAVAPDLQAIGWTARLLPACEGEEIRMCEGRDGPTRLDVPVTTFDVEVRVETGARVTIPLGASGAAGPWRVSLLAASATEPVERAGCYLPASGRSLLSAVRQPARDPCPEPPEVDRAALGLSVPAPETVRSLRVVEVLSDRIVMSGYETETVTFGWYGPDPRGLVLPGAMVTATRYPRARTGSGPLDVIEVVGGPTLATIAADPFILELPDLTAIGLELEGGEVCTYEQASNPCSGQPLVSERHSVRVSDGGSEPVEVRLGETARAGAVLVTLLEATQHPAVVCPGVHVQAWGPFGLTALEAGTE